MAWPVPLNAAGSARIPLKSINLFMALINTRKASTAVKPDSAFFFFASPTAIPAQKIRPRLFKIATSAPDRMAPKPFVTGLSRNGRISISLAFVNTFPTAINRPAMGRIDDWIIRRPKEKVQRPEPKENVLPGCVTRFKKGVHLTDRYLIILIDQKLDHGYCLGKKEGRFHVPVIQRIVVRHFDHAAAVLL